MFQAFLVGFLSLSTKRVDLFYNKCQFIVYVLVCFCENTKEDPHNLCPDSDTRWVGFQRFTRGFELEVTGCSYFLIWVSSYHWPPIVSDVSVLPPLSPGRYRNVTKREKENQRNITKNFLWLENWGSFPLFPLSTYISSQNHFNLPRSLFSYLYKKRLWFWDFWKQMKL